MFIFEGHCDCSIGPVKRIQDAEYHPSWRREIPGESLEQRRYIPDGIQNREIGDRCRTARGICAADQTTDNLQRGNDLPRRDFSLAPQLQLSEHAGRVVVRLDAVPLPSVLQAINARSAPKVEQLASRTNITAHQFHEGLTCQCVVCATCQKSIVVWSQQSHEKPRFEQILNPK